MSLSQAIIDNITHTSSWSLQNQRLEMPHVEYLSSLLKNSHARSLRLCNDNLKANQVLELSKILQNTELIEVDLSDNLIGSEGVSYLADVLKDTQITFLDLSANNIGDLGCEHLANGLKSSKIECLYLKRNQITDEGASYLVEALKAGCITKLDLCQNNLSTKSAELFNGCLEFNNIKREILLDIYDTTDSTKLISQYSSKRLNNTYMIIHKIGANLAKYITDNFKRVDTLSFEVNCLEGKEVENFAEAFKGITIHELVLHKKHVTSCTVEHLIKIFAKSRIVKLALPNKKIGPEGLNSLLKFLQNIDLRDLDLSSNELYDDGVCSLIPYLKSSNIRSLEIGNNHIYQNGFNVLAENLKQTKLVKLGLSYNRMGTDTALNMANGLTGSSITYLDLLGNHIEDEGAAYFQSIFKNTQIAWVNLDQNCTKKPSDIYTIDVKNNKILADNICSLFNKVIALNHDDISLDFAIYDIASVDYCIDLIKMLKENPMAKAHIIQHNLAFANEIDDLCGAFCEKFNMFVNNNTLRLICMFNSSNLVNIIKKFEQAYLSDIVQNFLLHRSLYYIDENEEILHPFVYKMLHKYDMPLYNENIEPKKKLAIISYFEQNPEIEGSTEVIEILKSS